MRKFEFIEIDQDLWAVDWILLNGTQSEKVEIILDHQIYLERYDDETFVDIVVLKPDVDIFDIRTYDGNLEELVRTAGFDFMTKPYNYDNLETEVERSKILYKTLADAEIWINGASELSEHRWKYNDPRLRTLRHSYMPVVGLEKLL